MADRPCDKCQRENHYTGNHPELQDPDVFYRVNKRANKHHSDHQMTEGQPVGTISQVGIWR